MAVDDVARRQGQKHAVSLRVIRSRMLSLEKQMRALEAAYDVSIAEHSGTSC